MLALMAKTLCNLQSSLWQLEQIRSLSLYILYKAMTIVTLIVILTSGYQRGFVVFSPQKLLLFPFFIILLGVPVFS